MLHFQPFPHLFRQKLPACAVGEHGAHLRGKIGRKRKLPSRIDRYLGILTGRIGGDAFILADAFEAQNLSGKQEGVASSQRLQEIFLDPAKDTSTPCASALAAASKPDIQLRRFDNRADIEPILLRDARIGHPPRAVHGLADFRKPLIGLERIAAGRHEIQNAVERVSRKARIGCGASHLTVKLVGLERLGAGHAKHVLGQYIQRPFDQGRRILCTQIICVECGAALHHLEAVGGHENGPARLVHPVVGAADTLREAARPLRRADMNNQIDIAPVDPEIERRGRDHSAQGVGGHGLLDLAALARIE